MKPKKKSLRTCKNPGCKTKFEPKNSNQIVCSLSCAVTYQNILKQKKQEKSDRDYVIKHKPETHKKEYKKALQDNINRLSRMIDVKFGLDTCIDCGLPLDEKKHQIDACHLIGRGRNSTISLNLHNLHSGHNHCNFYNPKHESNYKDGLINRYGAEYLSMVLNLPLKYKEIHLSGIETVEKLKIVRALIRNFDTYKFESAYIAREMFNRLIGIYK